MSEIPPVPTTEGEAVAFLRWCETYIGMGFHPDTSGAEYIDLTTGERSFTEEDAAHLDAAMDAVFDLLDDPYAVSLDLFHEINNIPREDN